MPLVPAILEWSRGSIRPFTGEPPRQEDHDMKTRSTLIFTTLATLAVLAASCTKKDDSAPQLAEATGNTAPATAGQPPKDDWSWADSKPSGATGSTQATEPEPQPSGRIEMPEAEPEPPPPPKPRQTAPKPKPAPRPAPVALPEPE